MTTKKPDYVTREAERFRNTPPGNRRRSDDVKALIRRVLRRAAGECERLAQFDDHAEHGSVYDADTARECRDAIRALATGGRG